MTGQHSLRCYACEPTNEYRRDKAEGLEMFPHTLARHFGMLRVKGLRTIPRTLRQYSSQTAEQRQASASETSFHAEACLNECWEGKGLGFRV